MRRLLALTALAVTGAPATGLAQSEFPVLLAEVDGETDSTELGRPFNAYHCANAASIPVVVTVGNGMVAASGSLAMWIGASSSACEDGSNRDSNPMDSVCETLGISPNPVNTDREIVMTFADMLGTSIDPCSNTASTGAAYRLYFFETTDDPYLADPVDRDWGYLGGSKTGLSQFVVDTQAPAAPAVTSTDVVGQRPTVRWDVPAGMETQLTYRVYVVESGACGGSATDGGLDAGADAGMLDAGMVDAGMGDGGVLDGGTGPVGPVPAYDYMYEYDGNGRTSATLPLDQLGVASGTTVTVYVTVLDFALNESQPSVPVCATYLPTGDFCTISGTCGDLCDCSVPGAGGRDVHPPLALLAALPLLGLWFARRRRHHR